MQKLMVTSTIVALMISRTWTSAEEFDRPAKSSQVRTRPAHGVAHSNSATGTASAVIANVPSNGQQHVGPGPMRTDRHIPDRSMSMAQANDRSLALMGVVVRDITDELAAHLPSLGDRKGWIVSEILSESPLGGRRGLQRFDVIVSISDQPINHLNDLRQFMTTLLGPDPTTVEIIRGGQPRTLALNCLQEFLNLDQDVTNPAQRPAKAALANNVRNMSMAMSSSDGLNYQLEISYSDQNGNNVTHRLSGTAAQILNRATALPDSVQQMIRKALEPFPESLDHTRNGEDPQEEISAETM